MAPLISEADQARESTAFPQVTPEELAAARTCGCAENFATGQSLFEPGQRPVDFFIVVNGSVDIFDSSGGEERLLVRHGGGSIIGDINVFAGRPAVAGCRAAEPTEALRLSIDAARRLLVRSGTLGEKWISALLRRRELMDMNGFEGLRVLGEASDAAALRLREFLHRNGVPHRWVDTADGAHLALLGDHASPELRYPVIAWGREVLMEDPSLADVARRIGVQREIPPGVFDTVIIGSGPAGLGAAVYAASEGLRTLVLDRLGPGGQAGSSSRIENYAGFPAGLSGQDLALRSYLQALKFGAVFSAPVSVRSLRCGEGGLHEIATEDGEIILTRTVIVATGVTYRSLGIEGLRELHGAGVYYAATQVEALLCTDTPVHVIGAGNSAGQAAMFLSKFSPQVNLIVRGGQLAKTMSSYLSERVEMNPRIRIRLHSEVRAIEGTLRLERVRVENTRTGEIATESSCGIFIFIGAVPCTDFLGAGILRDEYGFVLAGAQVADTWELERVPLPLETSCPGIFAAGDCRSRTTKRVAFAVGDGALAVTCVHDLLGTYV